MLSMQGSRAASLHHRFSLAPATLLPAPNNMPCNSGSAWVSAAGAAVSIYAALAPTCTNVAGMQ